MGFCVEYSSDILISVGCVRYVAAGIRGMPKAGENGVFYALVKKVFGMSHGGDGQK